MTVVKKAVRRKTQKGRGPKKNKVHPVPQTDQAFRAFGVLDDITPPVILSPAQFYARRDNLDQFDEIFENIYLAAQSDHSQLPLEDKLVKSIKEFKKHFNPEYDFFVKSLMARDQIGSDSDKRVASYMESMATKTFQRIQRHRSTAPPRAAAASRYPTAAAADTGPVTDWGFSEEPDWGFTEGSGRRVKAKKTVNKAKAGKPRSTATRNHKKK